MKTGIDRIAHYMDNAIFLYIIFYFEAKMRRTVRTVLLLLVLAMTFSIGGCVSNKERSQTKLTPGTYSATADGKNGPVGVSVTLTEKSIDSVKITSQKETEGIGDAAFNRLTSDIVKYQSVGVDAISGATLTSQAILDAVKDCILQANGDIEYWSLPIKKEAGKDEDRTADVIVIGGGSAGMAAASMARETGASVILIEKSSILGGNTAISGAYIGVVDPDMQNKFKISPIERAELEKYLTYNEADFGDYASTLTTLKKQVTEYFQSGKDYRFDSNERYIIQHYLATKAKDLDGNTITADYNLVKTALTQALDAVNWLKKNGVPFDNKTLGTRNQIVLGSGGGYAKALARMLSLNGTEVMLDTAGTELIVENGKVIGVKAVKTDGTKVTLHAKSGVVLATGGFAANIEMCYQENKFWKDLPKGMKSSNALTITGDGIKMGKAIGANTVGMQFIQLMMAAAKDGAAEKASGVQIWVNSDGKRFVDDSNSYSTFPLNTETFKQPDSMAFAVGDANMYNVQGKEKVENNVRNRYTYVGDTLEEVAKKAGINAENFRATVANYNKYVDEGKDPDFGRKTFGKKLEKSPFILVPMKPAFHQTMGGLQINTDAQVLGKDGKVIKGLYAAGEVTGGMDAGSRVSGDKLTECLVFGRIAGTNAAKGK